jgi:hypothetical protein
MRTLLDSDIPAQACAVTFAQAHSVVFPHANAVIPARARIRPELRLMPGPRLRGDDDALFS